MSCQEVELYSTIIFILYTIHCVAIVLFHFAEDIKKLWEELLEKKKGLAKQQEDIDSLLDEAFEEVLYVYVMNSFEN